MIDFYGAFWFGYWNIFVVFRVILLGFVDFIA